MKELNKQDMLKLEGTGIWDCISAGVWGVGAIAGGILGGPAGITVGYLSLGMAISYLDDCWA